MYNFLATLSCLAPTLFLNFAIAMKKKLEILVTNDDGFTSKGFKETIAICSKFGNITAIGPKYPQSGMSAALSMNSPLWLKEEQRKKFPNGNSLVIYSFTGTPVDCVKIAMNTVFSVDNRPDLLISGINHGSNASAAAIYSGTLGAAAEGCLYGINSIALSLTTHNPNADFAPIKKYFGKILKNYLESPPKEGIYLNINFPNIPVDKIKGIKMAHQGDGMWVNEFVKYTSPTGEPFYWICGEFVDKEKEGADGDHLLLEKGYVTIVPHKVDSTDYEELKRLSKLWKLR